MIFLLWSSWNFDRHFFRGFCMGILSCAPWHGHFAGVYIFLFILWYLSRNSFWKFGGIIWEIFWRLLSSNDIFYEIKFLKILQEFNLLVWVSQHTGWSSTTSQRGIWHAPLSIRIPQIHHWMLETVTHCHNS